MNNQNVRLNTVILHMFIHYTMGKSIVLMMQRYTATIVSITNLLKCILSTRKNNLIQVYSVIMAVNVQMKPSIHFIETKGRKIQVCLVIKV